MSAVRPPARSELEANPDSGFAQSSGRTALLQSPRRGEPPCSRIGHLQPAVSQTATMTPREPDSAPDFEPCFAAIDSTLGDHELIGRCASLHRDPCLPAEAAPMPGIDPPEAYCSSRQVLSLCPGSSKLERHENRQKRRAEAPVSFQICSLRQLATTGPWSLWRQFQSRQVRLRPYSAFCPADIAPFQVKQWPRLRPPQMPNAGRAR